MPNSGWRKPWADLGTWAMFLSGALDSLCVQWVPCWLTPVRVQGLSRKVPWPVSPALPGHPEEKPGEDYCVTRGDTGSHICSSPGIFGNTFLSSIYTRPRVELNHHNVLTLVHSALGQLALFHRDLQGCLDGVGYPKAAAGMWSRGFGISLGTAH